MCIDVRLVSLGIDSVGEVSYVGSLARSIKDQHM